MLVATSTTTIAWLIVLVFFIGFVVFFFLNLGSARKELGSELELAPNRKPYYDDETMEGPRLERMQLFAMLLLGVLTLGLPLYWIFEPARQAGAREQKVRQFENWGAGLYATTAQGGFNCAGCHGASGGGGQADWTLTDPKTGEVKVVQWLAPALNTATYRYSDEELTYILNYGRTYSPMSAWGTVGGGPMNFQQIETLIAYIRKLQIPRENCAPGETDARICPSGHLPTTGDAVVTREKISAAADAAAQKLVDAGKYATKDEALGEALFGLDLDSGAYSCARCHTRGWSYGEPGPAGQGAFGWNLTGGNTIQAFPNEADMITFVSNGSVNGQRYGTQAQGSGRMPGFGAMLTQEQIKAIVTYVRNEL